MTGKWLGWLIAAWITGAGVFCLIEMTGETGVIPEPVDSTFYIFRCLYVILLAGSIVSCALSFMRRINNRGDGSLTNGRD